MMFGSRTFAAVWYITLSAGAAALPPLFPCPSGGQAGRWGLCTAATTELSTIVNQTIVLRGSNYIRLEGPPGFKTGYHSTFDAGVYNRSRYIAAFEEMASAGYNVLRVFLDELPDRGIGGSTNSTVPLDTAWVERLAQFITDAEQRGLYTLITLVYCPQNKYFAKIRSKYAQSPAWAPSWNAGFLTKQGQACYEAYGDALGNALAERLDSEVQSAVIVSLQNEFFLRGDQYPFGNRHGKVDLADGISYDMAVASDRQQAADANTNLWAERIRKAIREHLTTSLVTVGVFTFQAVQKNGPNGLLVDGCGGDAPATMSSKYVPDCRFPARPYTLSRSDLDFLDVHIYQADGSTTALSSNLKTEEWNGVQPSKPIVMGEFGCNAHW